jgi:ubiquinone/menaquinone biosynthesis C-methylase UbiE
MATSASTLFSSSLPELYERFLVNSLFRPFAEVMLDRIGLASGERLLDVACGTGIVARLAQERLGDGGRVVGVDASPGMLGVARAVAPAVDWRQGDAASLPVAAGETFDAVTCHQGLQFFPDKQAAVRDMRRVLSPRGRVALATWRPLAETPLFQALHQVAERHLGPLTDQRHSFGDAAAITHVLTDAGLTAATSEIVTQTVRIDDGPTFARLNTMAVIGMSAAAKALPDEERARVINEIVNQSMTAMQPYLDGGAVVFELRSNLAIGRI